MATNYEKYFGTPEKVARMEVHSFCDEIEVQQFGEPNDIGVPILFEKRFYGADEYLEWLQEECE